MYRGVGSGPVELFEDGMTDLFDNPRLFGRQVVAPASGLALAIELTRTRLVLWDVLPRVSLGDHGQIGSVDADPEIRIQARHGSDRVVHQLLVLEERLRAGM